MNRDESFVLFGLEKYSRASWQFLAKLAGSSVIARSSLLKDRQRSLVHAWIMPNDEKRRYFGGSQRHQVKNGRHAGEIKRV